MAGRKINTLLWIGLTVFFMIGSSFAVDVYQVFRGDNGIWWTNQASKLPLEEARGSFELYIQGKLLQKRLSDGTLFAVDKDGRQYPVVPGDIAVRLNNWDKVKASILADTTLSGFALGVAAALLVVGLIQYLRAGHRPG